ncbi:glycerate kinase [Amnibacterium endophyticum]|uniref:Glycerate kinase n=1 Tax=Amnibacterium endophyticum TaxID=2109337 RepID=A0ABW4L924_9MICO
MRIVIAPDSFKGSIRAGAAAAAIAAGWHAERPGDEVRLLPQADGGEGTLDALVAAVSGAERRPAGVVTGPDGRRRPGEWVLLPDGTGVVELAAVSGIELMAALDPLGATTRGLGEAIGAALDAGVARLWIALGGSASTDGGTGALAALGARLLDAAGRALSDGGGALTALAAVDLAGLRKAPEGGVRLLADVTAPLTGPTGAAAVFGPQKGATPDQVADLDAGLARLAERLGPGADRAGAGAAGGTAYGFIAAWGAEVVSGAALVAEATRLAADVGAADLVITGEGRFDATSRQGKAVGAVLGLAERAGVPAVVIAGSAEARGAIELAALAGGAAAAMAEPARWLEAAGAEAARRSTRR